MIFRQLFDPASSTYTYLLADPPSREAVIIDPVFEQVPRDLALIHELELKLIWSLETHVHADHITGAWRLREATGARIGLSVHGGTTGADETFDHGKVIPFGSRFLEVRATPGHTNACVTYVMDDRHMAFTGDALLIRGCGRTDFQQGSTASLYHSVHAEIFSLPEACLIYPGHDYRGLTVTSVAEEKRFNPRLGGAISQGDFDGYMANLKLAHPKKISEALPANLKCGKPEGEAQQALQDAWAPLVFTFAGFYELEPHWLDENLGKVQVVDVREPVEYQGALGRIPGAVLIPLGQVAERAGELDPSRPTVVVCRAGARSARAVQILGEKGFTRIANLQGGMVRWLAEGHPVVGAVG